MSNDQKLLFIGFTKNQRSFLVNSVGVGREHLERYGDNPSADHQILKVNGLGATEVHNYF